MGDVEVIHEGRGRALREKKGKPGSAGWLKRWGWHAQSNSCNPSKQAMQPTFLVLFHFPWKKAYMSIDANHVSNPKDR